MTIFRWIYFVLSSICIIFALAKLIILFEMKRKININYILGACALTLFALCLLSISQPIRFQSEQAKREKAVKESLAKIRTAEEKFKDRYGVYTGDFSSLVKGGYITKDMQYIPFSDGKKFSLSATTIVGKSGKQTPLMECGATYGDYLDGLDENAIQELTDNASLAGRYPGLKIGDLTTDNNNAGNW